VTKPQPTNQPTKITIYSRVFFEELLVPANSFLSSQKMPHIMWNPKFHQHVHSCLPRVQILSQLNPVHALPSYYLLNTSVILTTQLSPWRKANTHSHITKPTESPHAISLRSISILSSSYAQVSTEAPSLQVLQKHNLSSNLQVNSLLAQNCIMLVTVTHLDSLLLSVHSSSGTTVTE
jgi:hypothetical protein